VFIVINNNNPTSQIITLSQSKNVSGGRLNLITELANCQRNSRAKNWTQCSQ